MEELISISSKFRFNSDGEGGEYETLVLDSPHMKKGDYSRWRNVMAKEQRVLGYFLRSADFQSLGSNRKYRSHV